MTMSRWRAKDTCQSVGHTVGTKNGFNKRKKKRSKEKNNEIKFMHL